MDMILSDDGFQCLGVGGNNWEKYFGQGYNVSFDIDMSNKTA